MENIKTNLLQQGYNVERLADIINEEEIALNENNNDLFFIRAEEFEELVNKINELDLRLKNLKTDQDYFEELNIEADNITLLINQAEFEFNLANYEQTEISIAQLEILLKNNSDLIISEINDELIKKEALFSQKEIEIKKISDFKNRLINANIKKIYEIGKNTNIERMRHIGHKMIIQTIPPMSFSRNNSLSVGSDIMNHLFTFL